MKETNIALIDLNPSTNAGCTLRDIVESCSKLNANVQYETSGDSKLVLCDRELSSMVSRCQPDLIFLVLSPDHLNQTRPLFESLMPFSIVTPF